jgi:hypothetical protein
MMPRLLFQLVVFATMSVMATSISSNFVHAQNPSSQVTADASIITYDDHIKPILRQHCLKCHGEEKQEADVNLQDFAALLRGGGSGKIVEAGRSSQSTLLTVLTTPDEGARMPPSSDPLPTEKIDLIRNWIDKGLRESSESESMVQLRNLSFRPTKGTGTQPDGPPAMPQSWAPVEPRRTNLPLPVLAMDSSPWAPLLAVADREQIRVIHTETQHELGRLAYPEGTPHAIRFSRSGDLLMVAGGRPVESGKVVLFDIRTGKRLAEIGDEIDAILAADLSPDQLSVAIGGSGKVVKVYSTSDGSLRYRLTKHTDWITAIAYSPDGTRLATADRAGMIHLWDTQTGGILLNLAEHKSAVRAIDWRGDSRLLASAGEDGHLIWWDTGDGFPAVNLPNAHPPKRLPGTFGAIPNGILAARFDSAGNLITSGRDRFVRYWSLEGKPLRSFHNEAAIPLSNAISHDGQSLISGDAAGALRFWKP